MIRVITNHPELASNDDTQIRFGNDAITFLLKNQAIVNRMVNL